MNNIDSILAFNKEYVATKGYEKHITEQVSQRRALKNGH